jgi:hypothetical protein
VSVNKDTHYRLGELSSTDMVALFTHSTVVDMHIGPQIRARANHSGRTAVDAHADEEGHLLALGVAQALVGEDRARDAVDGRREDDVGLDVALLVGADDGEVDLAMERGRRERGQGEQRGRGGGIGFAVRVDLVRGGRAGVVLMSVECCGQAADGGGVGTSVRGKCTSTSCKA